MPPLSSGIFVILFCCFMCLQALPFSYLNNEFTILQPIRSSIKVHNERNEDAGKLKLCPPGGRSFFEALQIACPMRKRRKRSTSVMFDKLLSAIDADYKKESYRQAKPEELMQICCASGCQLTDFFAYCGPFK